MAQYCRYCAYIFINNFPYCQKKEKVLSVSACKKPNKCDDYCFVDCDPEYQDAFMEHTKGYKPRKPKTKQECEGQVSLFGKE